MSTIPNPKFNIGEKVGVFATGDNGEMVVIPETTVTSRGYLEKGKTYAGERYGLEIHYSPRQSGWCYTVADNEMYSFPEHTLRKIDDDEYDDSMVTDKDKELTT